MTQAAQPSFEYLLSASTTSLESLQLSRLDQIADLKSQINDAIEAWATAELDVRVARLILETRATLSEPVRCIPSAETEHPALTHFYSLPPTTSAWPPSQLSSQTIPVPPLPPALASTPPHSVGPHHISPPLNFSTAGAAQLPFTSTFIYNIAEKHGVVATSLTSAKLIAALSLCGRPSGIEATPSAPASASAQAGLPPCLAPRSIYPHETPDPQPTRIVPNVFATHPIPPHELSQRYFPSTSPIAIHFRPIELN